MPAVNGLHPPQRGHATNSGKPAEEETEFLVAEGVPYLTRARTARLEPDTPRNWRSVRGPCVCQLYHVDLSYACVITSRAQKAMHVANDSMACPM